jgi:hypothetical protein
VLGVSVGCMLTPEYDICEYDDRDVCVRDVQRPLAALQPPRSSQFLLGMKRVDVCCFCSRSQKSLSLGSFTSDDVVKMQTHGNSVARQTWLATWTPAAFAFPEPRDTDRIRQFMELKYHRKTWFRAQPERDSNADARRSAPVMSAVPPAPFRPAQSFDATNRSDRAPLSAPLSAPFSVPSFAPTNSVASFMPNSARATPAPAHAPPRDLIQDRYAVLRDLDPLQESAPWPPSTDRDSSAVISNPFAAPNRNPFAQPSLPKTDPHPRNPFS